MTNRRIGWTFVAAQALLLLALIALPSRDDWATPSWLVGLGWIISIAGVALGVVAALGLGSALTPTPVPSTRGELTTTGLYGVVRHPIYTAVLAIVLGIVVRSGSVLAAALGGILIVFFSIKARWEEGQLAVHYPGYRDYATRTPRFLPRIRIRS